MHDPHDLDAVILKMAERKLADRRRVAAVRWGEAMYVPIRSHVVVVPTPSQVVSRFDTATVTVRATFIP